jgi:diacylglycerol kinase (ATP)
MGPKLAIIYKPVGSAKKGDVDKLETLLRQGGRDVRLFATTAEPDSAKKLALAAAEQGRDLIGVGGDGSVRMIAEAIYDWEQRTKVRRQMAIVPGGTGNIFINSFGPVPPIERFVQMVNSGKPRSIDLIRLRYKDGRERISIVGVGLGKISDAISDADPSHKKIFGTLAYAAGVTWACLSPGSDSFELAMPDQTVTVPNTLALFGLNVTPPSMPAISPDCNPSDGKLELVTVSGANLVDVVQTASSLALGQPDGSPHYQKFQVEEVTIRSTTPNTQLRPNIDGDPGDATEVLNLKVLHGAVDVVVGQ